MAGPTRTAARSHGPASAPARAQQQRPPAGPATDPVSMVMALQRAAGNTSVVRFLDRDGEPEPPEQEKEVRGPPAGSIAQPSPVSWGRLPGARRQAPAIAAPSVAPLAKVQNVSWFDPGRLGVTTLPDGTWKAPAFGFDLVDKGAAKGAKGPKGAKGAKKASPPAWHSTPKLTQKAYAGDTDCWYVAPGTIKTANVEAKKPVFWIVSPAMSARDGAAEGEHADDIKHAYKLSLNEAQQVLDKHVIGVTFGPKATKAAAQQLVLDTIKAKLTHPQLGTDQAKWGAKYDALYSKTTQRDAKGWHTFALEARKTDKAGNVFYKVTPGKTKIGTFPSAKLIKY